MRGSLLGEGFGPYTSTTLVKYPGLSFWLALNAFLGLPYPLTLNVLYAVSGLYLCAGLRAASVHRLAVAIGLVFYLFNPFTFDTAWTRLLREPLSFDRFTTLPSQPAHGPGLPHCGRHHSGLSDRRHGMAPLVILLVQYSTTLFSIQRHVI